MIIVIKLIFDFMFIFIARSIFSFLTIYSVGFLGMTLTTLPIVSQGDAIKLV